MKRAIFTFFLLSQFFTVSNLYSQDNGCANSNCFPIPEFQICENSGDSFTLEADALLTDIVWRNGVGDSIGNSMTFIVDINTAGLEDGIDCFYYTATDTSMCTGYACCPVVITVEDCCPLQSVVASDNQCSDNGTPNDLTDDTFSFNLTVIGTSGAAWQADDPLSSSGIVGNAELLGPYPIASTASPLVFTVSDPNDPTCTLQVEVDPPDVCSEPVICSIEAVASNRQCNDNGTPEDPTDDTFTFNLTVLAENAGASWTANDANSTAGTYGDVIVMGPYPISGGNVSFTVTDVSDANCTSNVEVVPPAVCSEPMPCNIDGVVASNVQCDDNGTPTDPSDDTFSFNVTVMGTNNGATWSANDANSTTGSYGNSVLMGPYSISGGALSITFTDVDDSNCTAVLDIEPPAACSVPCVIDAVVVSSIQCDDNGTPNDETDDTFTFNVSVEATSGASAGWAATDANSTTGTYGSSALFGPYPVTGGTVSFNIADTDDATCSTPVSVDPPAVCSETCEIEAYVSNIQCSDNGTPTNVNDDTFTFNVTISGNNDSGAWAANDANVTTGNNG